MQRVWEREFLWNGRSYAQAVSTIWVHDFLAAATMQELGVATWELIQRLRAVKRARSCVSPARGHEATYRLGQIA
jgi:hypothetical protein